MSRKKAKEAFSWDAVQEFLRERNVRLISAGLDEVPMAYKDIDAVMAAQSDLVEPLARFEPGWLRWLRAGSRRRISEWKVCNRLACSIPQLQVPLVAGPATKCRASPSRWVTIG